MYWHKKPEDITFQVTIGQLSLPSRLTKQDIHVSVCVGDMSKITCSGHLSKDGLMVTWNHPFLFFAHPSTIVGIGIYILPEKLTSDWDKQPLGDQIVTNVASLLKDGQIMSYSVVGLSIDSATLSITCKTDNKLIVPDGHNCSSALWKYGAKLYDFGIQSKNMASMSVKIEVELAILDLCPLGHIDHMGVLNNLGCAFECCFDQDGHMIDINMAIEVSQRILALCPSGHSKHAWALKGYVIKLERHYKIQKNKKDLDRLIEMQKAWLALCPLGNPDHESAMSSFAVSLYEYYLLQGDIADLNKAIEMADKCLVLCSIGHQNHHLRLNNLALYMQARYHKLDDMTDLNKAIELQQKCLSLRPPGHMYHGLALQNLAQSLWDRYYKMKDYSDLSHLTQLFKQALETYPVHHIYFALNISKLAAITLLSSEITRGSCLPDQLLLTVDQGFEVYKLLKKCSPAASLDLLEATQAWVRDAEKYAHSSVLDAYQTSLNTLDHFTSLNSSLDSRHETMQAKVVSLANDSFSCAIRHSDSQKAVELLEQGRGILWNQLACFDISVAELESPNDGCELGKIFIKLKIDLRKHAQQSIGQDTDLYWRVKEEWERVVDKIRALDARFSRFLLPPFFDDLRRVAEYGPVIIVNASEYGCDALIVLHDRGPVHVPLRCSLNDVVHISSQLSELTQDSHAYGPHRELYIKEVLRELWSFVVEPIAGVLQNDIELPLGSRIWWCPTSKFTPLPLHAAGLHRKGEKNLMDIYVSSYTPSLSSLLRARDRIRSQSESCKASGTATNVVSFAAIGQAHPSADTSLGQLPEVDHEIERICCETSMPAGVTFETITGKEATIEGAVQAFRDHRWVHVACHGAQHPEKPFDSWFAMGDGKLTLMRIIQERYANSELAFLSACHTAKGDASTPDEVLHLAAGMQFAGFNGVIGTLWRVDDAVAHQVVTRFYKEMFKHPRLDFRHAAAALNTAVIETGDEVSLEKRIVFVHIGI